jgi:hypothetical protein
MTVNIGDVFVSKKTAGLGFVELMVDGHLIHSSVVEELNCKLLPLENWTAKFVIATSAGTDEPATAAAMKAHEDFFNAKATAFKTPAKCKQLEFEEQPFYIQAAPYSPQVEDDKKAFALRDLEEFIGFLSHMDTGLTRSSLTLHSLIDKYCVVTAKNEDHVNALWMRMETLVSGLGTRPPTLGAEFETPSVCGAIRQVASMMKKVLAKLGVMKPQDKLVSQAKTALEIIFVNRLTSLREEFDKSLGTFRTTFVSASRAIGKRLGNLEVLTAGSYHASAGCGDDKEESRPGKKARTSEETKTLFQRMNSWNPCLPPRLVETTSR